MAKYLNGATPLVALNGITPYFRKIISHIIRKPNNVLFKQDFQQTLHQHTNYVLVYRQMLVIIIINILIPTSTIITVPIFTDF